MNLTDDQRKALEDLVTAASLVAAYQDQRTPYGLLSEVAERAGAALLRAEFDQQLCKERIYHGPGHQSSTNCRLRGEHEVHEAVYGEFNQYATWRSKPDGKLTFSGVFDESPGEDE
jgi:hypothetical protein